MGKWKHGLCKHPLYGVYYAMISRCYRKSDPRYKTYGGRGIGVCKEWRGENGFKNFYEWSIQTGWTRDKESRTQQSLDRINNDVDYCPENCKFTSAYAQAQHTTRSHYVTHNGETHTIAEWNRIMNFPYGLLQQRIVKLKWDTERAFTTPIERDRR